MFFHIFFHIFFHELHVSVVQDGAGHFIMRSHGVCVLCRCINIYTVYQCTFVSEITGASEVLSAKGSTILDLALAKVGMLFPCQILSDVRLVGVERARIGGKCLAHVLADRRDIGRWGSHPRVERCQDLRSVGRCRGRQANCWSAPSYPRWPFHGQSPQQNSSGQ